MACMFYFAPCINIISLLAQLVKYDVHTTRKVKSIHAIFITYYYYMQEFCVPVEKVQGCPRLPSAATGYVDLPRVQTSVDQRSFDFHGPTVLNSLPSALRDRQPVTEHVSAATEDASIWTVMNAITPPGTVVTFLCNSGAGYKCHDLLTYLLKNIQLLESHQQRQLHGCRHKTHSHAHGLSS